MSRSGDADGRRRRLRPPRRLDRDDPRLAGAGFLEAHHVGASVAAAAVREREDGRWRAELLEDLECGRLLTLEPVGVERIDEHVRSALGELARGGEGLVERAAHLEHACTEGARLGELPECHCSRRLQDERRQAGTRGVGGRRGGRVTGRGADDRAPAFLERLRERDGHPTVLERAGGVRALTLEPDVEIEASGETRRRQQRRAAFAKRHDRRLRAER